MTLLVSIPKIFVGGVKDNLWFALNRNAVSLVPGVYELALEGFVKVFTGMRESLKVICDLCCLIMILICLFRKNWKFSLIAFFYLR